MSDDLDDFLSDIDGVNDEEASHDESLRQSEEYARKGDRNIEDTAEGVDPEKQFADRVQRVIITDDIRAFQFGVIPYIKRHLEVADSFKGSLSDPAHSVSLEDILRKYKYTFLRNIENIEGYFEEYSAMLTSNALNKQAKKDFNIIFDGFEDQNRLDFIALKDIFLRLREFNSKVKKEWDSLSSSIGAINLVSNGKLLYHDLENSVQSAVDICNGTDEFLNYISLVLAIPEDDHNILEKEIFKKIIFHKDFSYNYNDLFSIHEDEGKLEDDSTVIRESESAADSINKYDKIPESEPSQTEDLDREERDEHYSKPKDEFVPAISFTVVGTRSWNSREPYVIRMNNEKLEKDYQFLGSSFYFIDDSVSESSIEGEMKSAMVKYIGKRISNITEGYKKFIFHSIEQNLNEAFEFFSFTDNKDLFVYHLGPFSVYKILVNIFQDRNIGYCYRFADGDKVTRFTAYEYIKESVLDWYMGNINCLSLPFDRMQEFDNIRKLISRKYYTELEKVNKVLDELLKKVKDDKRKKINKYDLFKSKWNKWFGAANIIIYQRFIEMTIF